jgi:hypothetical protein
MGKNSMQLKSLILNSLLIASSILGIANAASAERLKTVIDETSGTVYEVDLDGRTEYTSDVGWRHVEFWLSTRGDTKKHHSIASCAPYQVKSEYYNFDWLPNGGGYPKGSVGGEIARLACDN